MGQRAKFTPLVNNVLKTFQCYNLEPNEIRPNLLGSLYGKCKYFMSDDIFIPKTYDLTNMSCGLFIHKRQLCITGIPRLYVNGTELF